MNLKPVIKSALVAWKGRPPAGLIPEVPPGSGIPRIIHQVFFSPRPARRARLPAALAGNVALIRRVNPDWEHRLYDHDAMVDFIDSNYGGRVLQYFMRIRPGYGAARADLFRYLLLYRLGGAYLDIKSTSTQPLSARLRAEDRYVLSQWRNRPGEPFEGFGLHPELCGIDRGELQQWHIIAAPGHPFLAAVIERVLRNLHQYNPVLHGTGLRGVLCTTGPIPYTLAIWPLRGLHPHRLVDAREDLGLEFSLYARSRARSSRHHTLFGPHYSTLTEPLVTPGGADRLMSAALRSLYAIRGWTRPARRGSAVRPAA